MRGYLYKDWLLCRKLLIAACIVTAAMLIVLGYAILPEGFFENALQFAGITDKDELNRQMQQMLSNEESNWEWQAYTYSLTHLLMSAFFSTVLFAVVISEKLCKMDEQKVWASFAIGAPGAAKQYVTAKYVFCLLTAMAPVIAFYIIQNILTALTQLPTDCTPIYIMGFYLVLLLFGLTFPFAARFGYKQGNNIRSVCIIMLILAAFIYFLFGDISILQDSDALGEKLYKMMMGTERSTTISVLLTVLPCLSLTVFGLSYFYSCKAYAKGVAHYDC